MKIGIIVDCPDGLNWVRLQRLAKTVEACGFAGFYLSDHYTATDPPDKDSLETWIALAWLASNTKRIEFGSLVSPLSYRHPTMLARMAVAVDDLSGGRLVLGIGAGGREREHRMFGLGLDDVRHRILRFEEGAEVIHLLLHSDHPVSFQGEFYRLEGAKLLPRPLRPGGPPILIGGNGKQHTLRLAARFADEWNGVYLTKERLAGLNSLLDDYLGSYNRPADSVVRSLLTGCVFGKTRHAVFEKISEQVPSYLPIELRDAIIAGTADEIVNQIAMLTEKNLDKIMLVWYDLDDINGLEELAKGVLPYIK